MPTVTAPMKSGGRPGQQLEGGTAQVTCPPGQLQVDGSGEVDGDLTAADALGNLDPAQQGDRGQQRLAEPDVGRGQLLVVTGERAPSG